MILTREFKFLCCEYMMSAMLMEVDMYSAVCSYGSGNSQHKVSQRRVLLTR